MYFRFSQTATNFFRKAAQLFDNWNTVKRSLAHCDDEYPTTDVVYALAANLIGSDLCTLPTVEFINFVHMKPAINGFCEDYDFTEVFVTEFTDGIVRINNVNQYHPLHYHDKNFPTEDMIDYFRSMAGIS